MELTKTLQKQHIRRRNYAILKDDRHLVRRAFFKFYCPKNGFLVKSNENLIRRSHVKFMVDSCIISKFNGKINAVDESLKGIQSMAKVLGLNDAHLQDIYEATEVATDPKNATDISRLISKNLYETTESSVKRLMKPLDHNEFPSHMLQTSKME